MTITQTIGHHLLEDLSRKLDEANFSETWRKILQKMPTHFAPIPVEPIAPSYQFTSNEELFEWIDIVEAAVSAKEQFVMFELGAGYGRWCINAMIALKFLNPIPFHFVAVEAEDTHYKFLKKYFHAHDLASNEHQLIKAAIDIKKSKALFHMGEATNWYGQCIDETETIKKNRIADFFDPIYHWLGRQNDPRRKKTVNTITLNSLLENYKKIDLIDMDIQGKELEVIQDSIQQLNAKVKRLHIGTHSHKIDKELVELLSNEGWENLHLLPLFGTTQTPYGLITCNDGVQTWINPRLA